MVEQLQVEKEFLQRALGWGEERNPLNVDVTLESLPSDFPVDLSRLGGVRVLGGVRSAELAWRFAYSGGINEPYPDRRHWRVFLDVPGAVPDVFKVLLDVFMEQGWQPLVMFHQAFIEAEQTQWMGVNGDTNQRLLLLLRPEADITQVWLTIIEIDERQAAHLLGGPHPPVGFGPHYEAPLPTLILPVGWRAQLGQGSGGPVRSQEYSLHAPRAGESLVQELLAHLAPQFERQGWRQVYQEAQMTVFSTALGIGVLTLEPGQDGVLALIVHATAEQGRGPNYTLVSS